MPQPRHNIGRQNNMPRVFVLLSKKKRAKSVQRMVKIRTNGRRKLQHINFFSTNFCLRFRVLAYFDPIAPHWGRNFYKKQLKFI